jgi:pimeloyl-ACP methyl ester carboxylesterase
MMTASLPMRLCILGIGLLVAVSVSGQVVSFPAGFATREVSVNGARIHVRSGGTGPAVVLVHGYGETGDMWGPLAVDLARDHRVIVPDLRGLGLSSKPAGGFDKKTQAGDIAAVMDALGVRRADVVAHDIGNMVAYAFAALHPMRVRSLVVIDAPLPGVGPWEEFIRNPSLWHFRFGGPDMERLVAGRERIYLDRLWNDFSATPAGFGNAAREHYARLYAMPGAMRAGFAQFAAFDQDVLDNQAFLARGKLSMPVLALGGERSLGPMMATVMRFVASDVRQAIVPGSGHWIMEENPVATVMLVRAFITREEIRDPPAAVVCRKPGRRCMMTPWTELEGMNHGDQTPFYRPCHRDGWPQRAFEGLGWLRGRAALHPQGDGRAGAAEYHDPGAPVRHWLRGLFRVCAGIRGEAAEEGRDWRLDHRGRHHRVAQRGRLRVAGEA